LLGVQETTAAKDNAGGGGACFEKMTACGHDISSGLAVISIVATEMVA
jgi:hypothetical protein